MQAFDTEESVRLRKNIDSVQGRYAHLLSLTVLVMLLLAAAIVLRVYPKLLWNLTQLLCGLFFLVGLLSCYVLEQRRRLIQTQEQLIQELIRRETAERLAVIDPLTELFRRNTLRPLPRSPRSPARSLSSTHRNTGKGGCSTFAVAIYYPPIALTLLFLRL